MKTILLVTIASLALSLQAEEPKKVIKKPGQNFFEATNRIAKAKADAAGASATAKSTAAWISKIDVATVGALKSEEINGESQFGAGVDVGVGLNKFVSLHASALSYEGDDEWRGGAIDEASLGVQAYLSRFSTESFLPYVAANGVRSFGDFEDWAISLGLGAKLQFNDTFAVGGDYNIRAWFDGPEDSLARLYLQYSF